MLPGLVLLASINKTRFRLERGFSGNFLLSAALGAIWSALAFFFLYMIDAHSQPRAGFYARIALDTALIVILFLAFRPMRQVREILSSLRGGAFWLLLLAGLGLGLYSAFHFPHVFDSGQLLWTQYLLWGPAGLVETASHAPGANFLNTVHWESMIGFSGIIAPMGALFPDYPLVTVAAGFKPLLLVLIMFACHHIVLALHMPSRFLSTVMLAALMLLTPFGMYGAIELGKDSIFGIIFSVVFLVLLCQEDVEKRGIELALLFSAASVLGVIAVPYMLVALALWLLLAADARQARAVMLSFFLIVAVTLPVVVAGMLHKSYWLILAVYLVAAVLMLTIGLTRRFATLLSPVRRWTDRIMPALPLICLAGAALLLPVAADMPVWMNADGIIVTERRVPLDGLTGMGTLLLGDFQQRPMMIVGLAALLLMGLSSRVSKGMIAVAAMPLAATAIILIHFHLGLHFLTVFNQWDLIKDVPLWYGGAMFSILAIAGITHFARHIPRRAYIAGVLVFFSFIAYRTYIDNSWRKFIKPVYYTKVGGLKDRDFSVVSEITWNRLRNRQIFAAPSVIPNYFYSLQMFGGRPSNYSPDVFKTDLPALNEIGFAVPNEELFSIANYARRTKASLEFVASLGDGTQAFAIMKFDGKGTMSLPDLPEVHGRVASFRSGEHGVGDYENFSFRWLRKVSTLDIPIANGVSCLTIEAFRASAEQQSSRVNLSGASASPATIDLAGTLLTSRKTHLITVRSSGEHAQVRLEAEMPEIRFPNDARDIAWGIVSPVRVEPGKVCLIRQIN
jgi:hypothetical protein